MALRSPGRLAGLAALAPIAWGTYSAFSAEHDAPLPEALPGRRRVFDAPTAGRLAYYEDPEPGPGTSAAPLVLLHSVNAAASSYEMRPLFERYRGRRPVYALDLPSLVLPAGTAPTVTAFTMSGHVLGYARITATARR